MNIKKSQQFLYFQNKAKHYDNLRKISPAVKSFRQKNNYSTLQDRPKIPYFQRYQMQRSNEGMVERLGTILNAEKPEIVKHGYARYNEGVPPKSHYEIEKKKSEENITSQNYMLATKLWFMKPEIGTVQNWSKRFSKIRQTKRNISKFTDRRTSKGTIDLSSSSNNFIPEHYKSMMNKSLNNKNSHLSNYKESPQQMSINHKIKVEELFQLPKLKRMRGSLTRITDSTKKIQ